MNINQFQPIINFIWGVADDLLRDIYVKGKYRDVILPMTILRRIDVMLEPKRAMRRKRDFIARQKLILKIILF